MDDDGADRIEAALNRVETAINDKWTAVKWILIFIIGTYLWSVPGQIWHSKWRYTSTYNIAASEVYVQDKPHDCNFLAAPLGEKYCHYERTVSIVRWATSQAGKPIISNDNGTTWETFDPGGETVPRNFDCESDLRRMGEEGGLNVKPCTLIAVLLLAVPIKAQQAAQQPAQPAVTGHVLSAERHTSHHNTSDYNYSTGQWSNGSGNSVQREAEIQVGNLLYLSSQIHKEVQVGKDYPVNIETDKHGVAKKLDVMIDGKKYTYRITGTREAKSN